MFCGTPRRKLIMTQSRLSLFSVIASVAAVAAFTLPGVASAAYWHPVSGEASFITHPEHFKSDTTRAQVEAQAAAAMRQDGVSFGETAILPAMPATTSSKTRQQVIDELRNETPTER